MNAQIKQAQHTPGPWTISPGELPDRAYSVGKALYCVADVGAEADARLIAAVTDMAEALRTLVDLETRPHRPEVSAKAFAAARAALAKAGL
jgi:hypothetical protein